MNALSQLSIADFLSKDTIPIHLTAVALLNEIILRLLLPAPFVMLLANFDTLAVVLFNFAS